MICSLEIFKSISFNPFENLANEKYLFDSLPKDTLRIFLWQNENTVVIGKNQNPWVECNCELLKKDGGFVARRLSGGGAVFHDLGNLNFTFICQKEDFDTRKNLEIIKLALKEFNISAEISGRNDILANGKKFSGNAFYHTKDKSLHHGTILIKTSAEKLEKYLTPKKEKLVAKGVKSVESRVINLNEISPNLTPQKTAKNIIAAAEEIYKITAKELPLPNESLTKKDKELFSSWEHIFGRTPPFSIKLNKRFLWGDIELNINLSKGKISEIKVFTDSLDHTLSEKIEAALLGANYETSDIQNKLKDVLTPEILKDILTLIKNP